MFSFLSNSFIIEEVILQLNFEQLDFNYTDNNNNNNNTNNNMSINKNNNTNNNINNTNSNNNTTTTNNNNNNDPMAILSPPSSRYAFAPEITSNIPPLDNVLSPLLTTVTSPVSELNFANLNIISSPPPGYGRENDIPAFKPETEILLENFTNDLQLFNNWIKNLNNEEQKTAIGLFIESIKSKDVIEFIKEKISNVIINENDNENLLFSPPLSVHTNSIPQNLRPVSPIIPISHINSVSNNLSNNDLNHDPNNLVPITLDSILNNDDNINININISNNNNNNNDNDNDNLFNPAPRRILSPPIMKTGFSNIIVEPIERPKSAGPLYSNNGFSNINNKTYFNNNNNNNNNPMSPLLGSQPLMRVLSDDYHDRRDENLFNYYYNNNSNNNNNENTLGTKLQQSLNTINNRTILDSNKNIKEDRGRNRYLQNKINTNHNTNHNNNHNNHNNNMNMNMNMGMGMNMNMNMNMGMNYMNNMNNINYNMNNYGSKNMNSINGNLSMSGINKYSGTTNNTTTTTTANNNNMTKLKSTATHSLSVPPNNRIRSNRGALQPNSVNINESKDELTTTAKKNTKLNKNKNTVLNGDNNGNNLPKDIANDELLNDIPLWLKTLRLHKYTDKLLHLNWKELIELDDKQLEDIGVSTLGARTKLLKSFAYVKEIKNC